jgi:iron complex outermembrane receptor protein
MMPKIREKSGQARSAHTRSIIALGAALGVMPTAVQAQDAPHGLESIVVTAQKREENLQVVPVAVTAITSQTLAAARYESLTSLSGMAPGLSVRVGPGGLSAANLTMRGVFGSATYASDPGVAMYIDGMYLSAINGTDTDIADIERIEILRGPQGTLFGRNAIGGAVNVITKEPAGVLKAKQQLSIGNMGQFRSKTSLDMPAWGALSASVTYLHDERDGDVKNLGGGTVWHYGTATLGKYGDKVSPKTLGGHNTNAVAVGLKLEPGSDIKAVYRFNYSNKEYSPLAAGILSWDTGNAFVTGLFKPFWDAQDPATRTPVSATRPDAVNNWFSIPTTMKDQAHSLTITAPINDMISIKNLAAYRKMNFGIANNLSGLGGLLLAPGRPILPVENTNQTDQKSFQEELQVNIDASWVKSTIGYMHYWSHTIEGGLPNVLNVDFGSGLFDSGYVNFVAPYEPRSLNNDVWVKSDAFYTQNEIHVLPKLDLVLGGRWTKDRRGGLDNSPTPNAPGISIAYSKDNWTYLVGVNYKLTDDVFTYAKLSTAYISGGRLAGLAFDPTVAKSYEIGIKSDLLDNRLRLNLAAYTVKYDGQQTLTNTQVGCANKPGVSPAASQCIVNGGNERASGFEFETTYVPVDGLTLAGSLAYSRIRLSKIDPSLAAADGTFVSIYTPAWTSTLSAQYVGPDMNTLHGAHFVGRVEANYTSGTYGFPNSLRYVVEAGKIPARWIVDARVGLAGFQVGAAEVELAAYAKNLTDNKSIIYTFNSAVNIPANYEVARRYGLDLTVGF